MQEEVGPTFPVHDLYWPMFLDHCCLILTFSFTKERAKCAPWVRCMFSLSSVLTHPHLHLVLGADISFCHSLHARWSGCSKWAQREGRAPAKLSWRWNSGPCIETYKVAFQGWNSLPFKLAFIHIASALESWASAPSSSTSQAARVLLLQCPQEDRQPARTRPSCSKPKSPLFIPCSGTL